MEHADPISSDLLLAGLSARVANSTQFSPVIVTNRVQRVFLSSLASLPRSQSLKAGVADAAIRGLAATCADFLFVWTQVKPQDTSTLRQNPFLLFVRTAKCFRLVQKIQRRMCLSRQRIPSRTSYKNARRPTAQSGQLSTPLKFFYNMSTRRPQYVYFTP